MPGDSLKDINWKHPDIGLMWGIVITIYGQLGVFFSTYSIIMMFGVFYSTTAKGHVSFPIYLLIILGLIIISVGFVLKVGINGYYRFFQQQSAINKLDRKLDFVIKHMGLEYKDKDDK